MLATLDQLNDALTKLLNNMLRDDLEDIDIEIDVFEQMLKSDGLKDDDVTAQLRQSALEAAKEQPMSSAPSLAMSGASASARQLTEGTPVLNVPHSAMQEASTESQKATKA